MDLRLGAMETAVAANSFLSIAFRNEHVINGLYHAALASAPRSAPLWWRRLCSKVYCFGGIHSGAGVAASIWFMTITTLLVKGFDRRKNLRTELPALVVAICTWILLVAIIAFASPQIRHRLHNSFEQVHRYCGWMVVVLLWVETMILGD